MVEPSHSSNSAKRVCPHPPPSGNRDMVAAMEALKGLVDELGVEQVVRLARLFG